MKEGRIAASNPALEDRPKCGTADTVVSTTARHYSQRLTRNNHLGRHQRRKVAPEHYEGVGGR